MWLRRRQPVRPCGTRQAAMTEAAHRLKGAQHVTTAQGVPVISATLGLLSYNLASRIPRDAPQYSNRDANKAEHWGKTALNSDFARNYDQIPHFETQMIQRTACVAQRYKCNDCNFD
jgi:hypothetical protein